MPCFPASGRPSQVRGLSGPLPLRFKPSAGTLTSLSFFLFLCVCVRVHVAVWATPQLSFWVNTKPKATLGHGPKIMVPFWGRCTTHSVGIGMFTGRTIWVLSHGHFSNRVFWSSGFCLNQGKGQTVRTTSAGALEALFGRRVELDVARCTVIQARQKRRGPSFWLDSCLTLFSEFMNFKLFGKAILVVNIKFGLFLDLPSTQQVSFGSG